MLHRAPGAEPGPRILILGIGNTLLSDEGVGVKAIEVLRDGVDLGADVTLVDGGTLSFSLLPLLDDVDSLLVVDAARLGLGPGAVRRFTGPRMDRLLRAGVRTAHEVGLKELLDLARLGGRLPRRRALVGVEPLTLDWGTALSPPVSDALERVQHVVRRTVARWKACRTGVPV